MLTYRIYDIAGHLTILQKPVYADIVFSADAPAAGMRAVFTVEGNIPQLYGAEVFDGETLLFCGLIDEQSEKTDRNGKTLEIRARSREALLLDNEAAPQIYFMPSMPLLMERHFSRYGFTRFVGESKAFNGRLTVAKGMSEWELLSEFCWKFLRTVPYITIDGTIDISGQDHSSSIYLGRPLLSVTKKYRRSCLFSELHARTYSAGGYEMPFFSSLAEKNKVQRIRYVNAVDSTGKTIEDVQNLLSDSESAFETYELSADGIVCCCVGDTLRTMELAQPLHITEIHYIRNSTGEKTRIYAEVKH